MNPAKIMIENMENRLRIASWAFVIGSSLFVVDAMTEIIYHFSPFALLHLSEGILFLLGSIFFIPETQAESE